MGELYSTIYTSLNLKMEDETMELDKLREDVLNKYFNNDEFLISSVYKKLDCCEPIHIIILRELYDDAKKKNIINDFGQFNPNLSQSFVFSELLAELRKKLSISDEAFYLCINDLETINVIVNVQINTAREWSFGITPFGVRCLKVLKYAN